ncbi:MAG: hypothetical protein JWN04_4929, partial [Myxococcaceae bacterium]|nr:hypothetical protein [Myxococcaceae bacterium]
KGSAERIRLRWRGGKRELTRGPLRGENELVAGLAMLQVKSLDEAVTWTTRIAETEGCHDVEFDLGPLVEGWDLGLAPKPPGDIPLRVLAVRKADSHSEAGTAPSAETMTKMQALLSEMKAAGVLLAVEGLKPSARGARLQTRAGKHTWVDGPFTESKELIAGFTMIKLPSLADAKAWAARYADILGDTEVDVREVFS